METLVAPLFNFLVLVGFLAVKLKQPLREFIAQRHNGIRDEVDAVKLQLKQAQEQYEEFSGKLKGVDSEIAILREQAKQDAVSIKQKVMNEARRVSGMIVSDAKNQATNLFGELRAQLYFDFSDKVLQKSELLLREKLTGDDRVRIRQEFSRQVERIQ